MCVSVREFSANFDVPPWPRVSVQLSILKCTGINVCLLCHVLAGKPPAPAHCGYEQVCIERRASIPRRGKPVLPARPTLPLEFEQAFLSSKRRPANRQRIDAAGGLLHAQHPPLSCGMPPRLMEGSVDLSFNPARKSDALVLIVGEVDQCVRRLTGNPSFVLRSPERQMGCQLLE